MRIVIITQNEPFYLSKSLDLFLKLLPKEYSVVGCVLSTFSPFGSQHKFFKKILETLNIFGLNFLLYYSIKYIIYKLNRKSTLDFLLKKEKIDNIVLDKSINHKDSIAKIESYKPDLLVSILGNQIFKDAIINLAPKGCINLHTALLPKYRGLMPTFWVLKNNEKYTGVSVFYVNEGIDSGPIIVQKKIKIGNRTQEELIKYTKIIGMECLVEAIEKIKSGNISTYENKDADKTYFSFPSKEDVLEFKKNNKKFF